MLTFADLWLSLIGRYCHRIKSLKYSPICNEKMDETLSFFRMYGHKLEELYIFRSFWNLGKISEYCPNVKNFFQYHIVLKFFEMKEYLPKLEQYSYRFTSCYRDIERMIILSDNYSQSMKKFEACLYELTAEQLKTCSDCISRLENFNELKFEFTKMEIEEPIDDCLSLIGQKCNKLLKLDLRICYNVKISQQFFTIFSNFKVIKELSLSLPYNINTVLSRSVECFKHCKQLKHLDITYPGLREHFFANIASFVPKLQFLWITTEIQFSESFVDSFPPMKSMLHLNLTLNNPSIGYQNDRYFPKYHSKNKCLSMDSIKFPKFQQPI